jgi:hypothetical protein
MPSQRQHRVHELRRRYGITPDDYDAMADAQGGVCAICGLPPRKGTLDVDHDHATGRVRGLLCRRCNPMVEVWIANRGRIDAYLAGDCGTLLGPREVAAAAQKAAGAA